MECFATFEEKKNLNKHIGSVHSDKKFKCKECDMEFNRSDSLKRHELTHTKPQPVKKPKEVKVKELKGTEPKKSDRTQLDEEETSAFNRRIVEKKWNLRNESDLLEVFSKYKEKILHRMGLTLEKHQFKMDIVILAQMTREDREGYIEEVRQFFYGGARTVLREDQFDDQYSESTKKIWNDFDKWISNGSGWRMKYVERIYLNTAAYEPIRGQSYIKTPESKEGKKQ